MLIRFFCLLDPSLGKIDKSSMSHQTLMEVFVQNITHSEKVCGSKENPKSISEWNHVIVDEKSEVIGIDWDFGKLHGSVSFDWLPPTSKRVKMYGNAFEGSIDFCALPGPLEELLIGDNRFCGELDLTRLPPRLVDLDASDNAFSGEVDLTKLPTTLECLNISYNQLLGPLNLKQLHEGMRVLFVRHNDFCGFTDLSKLPKSLYTLFLSGNPKLSGSLVIRGVKDFSAYDTAIDIDREDRFLGGGIGATKANQ
mmetsp:Transcript_6946/g.10518  ORF Transcript_6946/g.10518 Transcript_6946/m.10518 type:complete len:253 (-) Transcript_6946:64-822(-)|eukprot:CAMPEP_0201524296 /NCGR_PEP_ID=MMETSP0161_2-20130828/21233_1 /ASSEMBLY_ACC=CAM_ASM_000251 /TAXON_ID=180227 /ORGANISM="Neoparamoeba aestuarina, Strain SoJaBio B1-5/56/2" /LENGTH=252 /DNA_ID=CAMNT_0047923617 /DNA_START=24 /DNA_END=782 /DNA_ORIENTATION=-